MKIGINLTQFKEITGIEVYAKELLLRFGRIDPESQFYLYTNRLDVPDLRIKLKNYKIIKCPINPENQISFHLYLQVIFPIQLVADKIDVLFNPAFFHPLFCKTKQVTTIHDCIYLMDNDFNSNSWITKYYMRKLIGNALKKEEAITISYYARTQIEQYFNKPFNGPVIYNGFTKYDMSFNKETVKEVLKKFNLENKSYLFYIGQLVPHKNINRILLAYKLFVDEQPETYLVLSGKERPEILDVKKELGRLKLSKEVILTGLITEKEKAVLFKKAKIILFPSLHEGFGIPILEAQQFGVPLITSREGSMPEVAGEGALFVNPYVVEEIFDSIINLTKDEKLRKRIVDIGGKNLMRFSWDDAAKKTLAFIKDKRGD